MTTAWVLEWWAALLLPRSFSESGSHLRGCSWWNVQPAGGRTGLGHCNRIRLQIKVLANGTVQLKKKKKTPPVFIWTWLILSPSILVHGLSTVRKIKQCFWTFRIRLFQKQKWIMMNNWINELCLWINDNIFLTLFNYKDMFYWLKKHSTVKKVSFKGLTTTGLNYWLISLI